MIDEFLKKVPLFAGLPQADLERLCQSVAEVRLPAGQELFAEGSPGDRAYIIKEGQLDVVKASAGREVLLAVQGPPQVIGETALLVDMPRMASVRARTDAVLLAITNDQLDHLLRTSPSALHAMFHTVLSRLRDTEATLRNNEKMAQLGTLTAGVAHELNNPAAAVKRGADQLRFALEQLGAAQLQVASLALSDIERQALERLAQRTREAASVHVNLDVLERSDRQQAVEAWLDQRGVGDAWEVAPAMVDMGYDADGLASLAQEFSTQGLPAVVRWVAAIYAVHGLIWEIGHGAGRISDIVKALKSYSYLDQAPVQAVDVREGLEDTLLLLRHKLKSGITVRREYAPDLPKIEAYGSELNQVWTNLIDNAADALEGRGGVITVRTRRDRDGVLVEVEDDGPGIPKEIQPRIFDSFFTTKPPGKGTGLGLSITYNIVVHKHRGEITVDSQPGRTCFRVWLPLSFEKR